MRARDVLSIGYVHPLTQTILCVWVIGRAAGAIAGEIDRGTMELLQAQPLPRYRVILAHLGVDVLTIPLLCLCVWAGNWRGSAFRDRSNGSRRPTVAQLRSTHGFLLPAC